MFYIVEKIVIAIACYVDIYAIGAWFPDWGVEVYTAIVTVIIAVIALSFSIWQGLETRRHNRLSVRPVLERVLDVKLNDDTLHYMLAIVNQGTGPAIVKKFQFLLNGKTVSCNDYGTYHDILVEEIQKSKGKLIGKIGFIVPDSVIKDGEQRIIWELKFNKEDDVTLIDRLDLRVEYQSIYEENLPPFDTRKYRLLDDTESK